MAGAGADNPRAVAVWEVVRAVELATPAQRAEVLAMLTGQAAPGPELKPLEIDLMLALRRRQGDLPLPAIDLAREGGVARNYSGYVFRTLYAFGLVMHVSGGWQLTEKGHEMCHTL